MSSGLPPSTVIPQGVGAPPPPGLDPKRGKLMCIKVRMLDDTVGVFHLGHKAVGQALFDEVCRHLNLLECDYFGLEFKDSMGNQVWLDKEKPILRQITSSGSDARFCFCVKFYTSNPADLEEEYTRYLFALQIKRDLSRGEFVCNETTAALMAAYIVQSECGDYSHEDYPDHTYLNTARFIPQQTPEFQVKVMDNHKKLVGMSPAESDLALLETARRCDFYGVKFHHAKDIEGTEVNVAVQHLGVRVFHQLQCATTFSWAKIRKLSFKRKKFLIKLHPESYQYYKDTIEFVFETRNESKAFWKKCVEHHAFFRCTEAAHMMKQHAKLFSKGSSFKYNGRTQKQLIDYVREHHKRREPFTRPIHSSYVRSPCSIIGSNYGASDRSLPTPLVPAGVGGPHVLARPQNGDLHAHAQVPQLDDNVRTPPEATNSLQRRLVNCATNKGVAVTSPTLPVSIVDVHTNQLQQNFVTFASSTKSEPGLPQQSNSSSIPRKNVRMCSFESAASDATATPPFPRRGPQLAQSNLGQSTSSSIYTGIRAPLLSQDSGATSSQSDIMHNRYAESSSFSRSGTLEGSGKRKKLPNEKSYFIVKELLCTERTYVKDMEIVCKRFRETVTAWGEECGKVLENLFCCMQPLLDLHANCVNELQIRLSAWENRTGGGLEEADVKRVADILLCSVHNTLQAYHKYISHVAVFVAAIDELRRTRRTFDLLLREFESRKVCYIPLNQLLLRPPYRLYAWQQILCRLVAYYTEQSSAATPHHELAECRVAFDRVSELILKYKQTILSVQNFCKMVELEKDLIAVDNLLQPNRTFLREGCLQRYSNKGPVQRMFLLFNDCLLYANRSGSSAGSHHQQLQFKLHGQIPLRGLMLEDGDPFKVAVGMHHCFTVYGDNRSLILSCSSDDEKRVWLDELRAAVATAKESSCDMPRFASLKSTCSTEEVEAGPSVPHVLDASYSSATPMTPEEVTAGTKSPERQLHHRANNTLHVCWHRCTTVGQEDISRACRQHLSGYLLRKFRNSSGWQRLWVVYSHFCLFFYKSHSEDCPLASLPLLGYRVAPPDPDDCVSKDHVFKLHYKSHYYLFRAESDFTYLRWMEVIDSVCSVPAHQPIVQTLPE